MGELSNKTITISRTMNTYLWFRWTTRWVRARQLWTRLPSKIVGVGQSWLCYFSQEAIRWYVMFTLLERKNIRCCYLCLNCCTFSPISFKSDWPEFNHCMFLKLRVRWLWFFFYCCIKNPFYPPPPPSPPLTFQLLIPFHYTRYFSKIFQKV